MVPPPEDLWFERYRASGDPAALAEVYDRTAERLLRAALHMVRSPTIAGGEVWRIDFMLQQDRERLPCMLLAAGTYTIVAEDEHARRCEEPLHVTPRRDGEPARFHTLRLR